MSGKWEVVLGPPGDTMSLFDPAGKLFCKGGWIDEEEHQIGIADAKDVARKLNAFDGLLRVCKNADAAIVRSGMKGHPRDAIRMQISRAIAQAEPEGVNDG